MPKFTEDKFAKILERIRNLTDRANHPNTPEAEAVTARTLAEKLMRDYRVEEEHLIAADPQSVEPEVMFIDLVGFYDEFTNQYATLFAAAAQHAGVRYRFTSKDRRHVAQAVGYAADIRYADLLYTAARAVFGERLQPKVNPHLTEAENIYRLRSAGISRGKVAEMLWGSENHQRNLTVGRVYKEESKRRGEVPALDGRGVSAATYREAYAGQFVQTFWTRLQQARDGADRATGTVQLHGRSERVDEAFYTMFPELRPSTTVAKSEPCAACLKAKSGRCRAHKGKSWTKADEARYQQQNHSAAALAGKSAGRSAASEVPLDGSNSQRLDRYTAEEREATREIWAALGQ